MQWLIIAKAMRFQLSIERNLWTIVVTNQSEKIFRRISDHLKVKNFQKDWPECSTSALKSTGSCVTGEDSGYTALFGCILVVPMTRRNPGPNSCLSVGMSENILCRSTWKESVSGKMIVVTSARRHLWAFIEDRRQVHSQKYFRLVRIDWFFLCNAVISMYSIKGKWKTGKWIGTHSCSGCSCAKNLCQNRLSKKSETRVKDNAGWKCKVERHEI